MTQQIGLTGGIGVGKTTVSNIFSHLGVPIFNSDLWSKNILKNNKHVKRAIKIKFGNNIIDNKGEIDKQKLGRIVFSNKKKLNFLNKLIHPLVIEKYDKWLGLQKTKYIIKESALIFESDISSSLNKIILIKAPLKLRIERVCNRDNRDRIEVENIISNQVSPADISNKVDFIINNDGTLLTPQIIKLHNKLLTVF